MVPFGPRQSVIYSARTLSFTTDGCTAMNQRGVVGDVGHNSKSERKLPMFPKTYKFRDKNFARNQLAYIRIQLEYGLVWGVLIKSLVFLFFVFRLIKLTRTDGLRLACDGNVNYRPLFRWGGGYCLKGRQCQFRYQK